jgi:hypothetical protein
VEEAEGIYFITTELVRGKRLSELLPKHGFPLTVVHELLLWLAYLQGDEPAMAREAEWVRGKPGEPRMLALQASIAGADGKLGEARRLREQAAELARQRGLKEIAAGYLLDQAVAEAALGEPAQARLTLRKERSSGRRNCRCGLRSFPRNSAGAS